MSAGLSMMQIGLLAAYAIGMVGGQLLFKAASLRLVGGATLTERLFSLALNPYFIAAMALYLALSVFWVWILTFTPLSRAYPFVALAFAITPLLGALLFAEVLSLRLMIGIGVIVVGLILVAE